MQGVFKINQRVINMAQVIKYELGVLVHVGSGYRCAKRKAAVEGVKGSKHVLGKAADLNG